MEHRKRKQLISADGAPYTPWQKRTRAFCWLMIAWAIAEIAVGAGFVTVSQLGVVGSLAELVGPFAFGFNTIFVGAFNLVVGFLGVRSARDPHKSAAFFWLVVSNAVLMTWDFASTWSMGLVSLPSIISLLLVLFLAACAWNLRGQTGYFDKHPHPEDDRGDHTS